jgi:hypothetical protein
MSISQYSSRKQSAFIAHLEGLLEDGKLEGCQVCAELPYLGQHPHDEIAWYQ